MKAIFSQEEIDYIPSVFPTKVLSRDNLESFFYEGLPYRGKQTRVYAYYGVPEGDTPSGGWPGIVLVHGGGGTAFPWMVKEWNKRGFAALSMDLEGHLPDENLSHEKRLGHKYSGPSRQGIFEDYREPVGDQWFYHGLGSIIRAHSLLRSFPQVNQDKTGIMGISWGAILTCSVLGLDHRYKFAVPVYGCGYLHQSDGILCPEEEQAFPWDPSLYLRGNRTSTLFVNGTNDRHFPLSTWEKTCSCSKGPVFRCIKLNMEHGHRPFIEVDEIFAFIHDILIGRNVLNPNDLLTIRSNKAVYNLIKNEGVVKIILYYTRDRGLRSERRWQSFDVFGEEQAINIPELSEYEAFFLNFKDEKGLVYSSQYHERNI